MIGTLWKQKSGKFIYILTDVYVTTKGTTYHVLHTPSGRCVTINEFFFNRNFSPITEPTTLLPYTPTGE